MAWRDDALAVFHDLAAETGVAAQWTDGAGVVHISNVLFAEPTNDVLGGMQQSDEYSIEFDPEQFPGLRRGQSIMVAGVSYTVRENPMKTEDGFTSRANLKR